MLGMASALETLCGKAYGAKQYHMLGVYLQRSWIVLFICSLFLLPVFIFTTPILKLLGQDEYIAEVAGIICSVFTNEIDAKMEQFLDIMIVEDGGPTVEECMQKLVDISWTTRTPLYIEASIIFLENPKCRKEWIHLYGSCDTPDEEAMKRWLSLYARRMNLS
uniref:Uncharacterized protein n=1 Tax=Nelumbo nucifera TaxID=4432 RepID=A0A822ZGG4_NELNU|nr:TPA_asm: hypothetical protein HUJ06_001820 [Nelumbo nucifera]